MEKFKQSEAVCNGRTQIHNVRFYNLSSRSIQTMAYNKVWKKLAFSRNDGSIEIWDMANAPCLERTISKTPCSSVEGLAWCSERLFSAGLSGEIIEWNLQTLRPRNKQHVTGNAIWCLDVNRLGTDIAIGTEEGYINLFDISDNQFQYKNLFDKQEGRVLCCRFDATGDFLVTGSVGAIRIWNTRTGHAINKMTLAPRLNKAQETIVWSIQVLMDFTIISGDSCGYISMWDGKNGTQIESLQALNADVLAVTVNEEENKLFCAGIEPNIRIYSKTQITRDDMVYNRWVKFLQRRVHDYDVKAIVCDQDYIYSGGVDGYLGVSSVSKTQSKIVRYGPFLQPPCVTVAPQERLLLLRYTNYLEIWRMGSSVGRQEFDQSSTEDAEENRMLSKNSQSKFLSLDTVPEKLLEFKSKNEETIVCAVLSPNGRWLCYSTQKDIRLFQFIPGNSTQATQLVRVKDLPEQFTPASHVAFIADSMRLIMVNRETAQIQIFSILTPRDEILNCSSSPPLDFVECIDTSKHIKDSIKLFSISLCGSYIVAASADRTIAVWSVFQGKHYKHLLNLPRYTAATTALAIHVEQPRVVASFADGKIFEYDMDEMCFICSDIDRFVANSENFCINNIVLDPRNPNIFVMQNDSKMFVLEKCTQQQVLEVALGQNSNTKSLKKSKVDKSENIQVTGLKLKMEKTFEHLISLCWLSPNELVAVSVNPLALLDKLPNPFKEKRFRST